MNIVNYLEDGAGAKARVVLMLLQSNIGDGFDISYNKEQHRCEAVINIARWENCREQGYVVSLRTKDYSKQLNIAWFEHRNSDDICAIEWEQCTINSPTIDTAKFGDIYKSKYDVSKSVKYNEYIEMADWIFNELENFWIKNTEDKHVDK